MEQTQNLPALGLNQKVTGYLEKYPVILQLCRFGAIGILNTALDFLILNFVSETLNITKGLSLGGVNIIGFSAAVVQSYFWNRYWAFGDQEKSLLKNFIRLVMVGLLGAFGMAAVFLGAAAGAFSFYYLIVLVVYVAAQIALWKSFGLSEANSDIPSLHTPTVSEEQGKKSLQFWSFLIVSFVGLLINSGLVGLLSERLMFVDSAALNKNVAKIIATLASLIWNFVGYKLVVFKK